MPDSNHDKLRDGIIDLLVNLNKQRLQLNDYADSSTHGSPRHNAFVAKAEKIKALEKNILKAMVDLHPSLKPSSIPIINSDQRISKNGRVYQDEYSPDDNVNINFEQMLQKNFKITATDPNIGKFIKDVEGHFTEATNAYKGVGSGLTGFSGLLEMAWAKMRAVFTGYKSGTEQTLAAEGKKVSELTTDETQSRSPK